MDNVGIRWAGLFQLNHLQMNFFIQSIQYRQPYLKGTERCKFALELIG